jgi:hypothetical protein
MIAIDRISVTALVDGALLPHNGMLRPDRSRPGLGLELTRAEAGRYAA